MRARAMNRRALRGRDIKADVALRRKYAEKLVALVTEMHRSTVYWLMAEYKRQLPRVEKLMATDGALAPDSLADDASPARDMLARLREQMRRHRAIIDEKAQGYAEWFAARANSGATARTKSSLSEMFGFTVGMKGMTRNVNNVLQSVIGENVALIKSIPEKYFTELEGLVMRSVRTGRDIATLTDELEKLYLKDLRDRALLIARDQNNKASAAISRARMQDAGVEMVIWRHSSRAKHPRPSHLEADGKIFPLSEGLLIDGDYIFPGEEINCGCTAAPYVERMTARSAEAMNAAKQAPDSPLRRAGRGGE